MIIICFLILTGCRLIKGETETTTIYRNPNGNATMTWQVSNITSEGDDSEEQLEDYRIREMMDPSWYERGNTDRRRYNQIQQRQTRLIRKQSALMIKR